MTGRVDRIARTLAGGQAEVDVVAELFKPLPSFVVAHYLGVPEADRSRFDGWTDQIVAAGSQGDPLIATEAVAELLDYFTRLARRRRAEPGDDTISDLVAVFGDDDPSACCASSASRSPWWPAATTPPRGCSAGPASCWPPTPGSGSCWCASRRSSRRRSRSCSG
nr:hypothetical protein GCM10020093_033120 [Planobispora longispora]